MNNQYPSYFKQLFKPAKGENFLLGSETKEEHGISMSIPTIRTICVDYLECFLKR